MVDNKLLLVIIYIASSVLLLILPLQVVSCVPRLWPGPRGSRATDRWQHSCKARGVK